jgi:hypothetical protein
MPRPVNRDRGMKAEDCPAGDANPAARNDAQHQRAGREAGTLDDNALPRLAYDLEEAQVGQNFAARTRPDPHLC